MKILIVDDSKMILQMAVDVMRVNHIEAEIETELIGKKVVDRVKNDHFDLIILDVIMPEISGMDILRQLQELGILLDSHVMMFTSLSDKRALRECFRLGAFDYINKPIEPDEFIARVQNALTHQKLRKNLSGTVQQMQQQNEELTALNEQLQETQTQLLQQEQMAGIGQLAAGVAHEVNNPLGFVISNLEILKEYMTVFENQIDLWTSLAPYLDTYNPAITDILARLKKLDEKHDLEFIKDDIRELFDDTNTGLSRVSKIVEGLRVFSRVDQLDELEEYELDHAVESMISLIRGESKYTADIVTEYGHVPPVKAMGGYVNQVILNVMMNALQAIKDKHGEERGLIKIKTYQQEDKIYVSFEDDGIGMDDQVQKDIFKPFFTTKPIGDGTGLGLSIVRDIVITKHGGTIDVSSQPGVGTRFVIGLPRTVVNSRPE